MTVVKRLGVAEQGLVRLGCACYTTDEEVARVIEGVQLDCPRLTPVPDGREQHSRVVSMVASRQDCRSGNASPRRNHRAYFANSACGCSV